MEVIPHVSLSRLQLESLSTGELVNLADNYGIDIPPGLERIFIIEELLENSFDNKNETEVNMRTNPAYKEPVALPKQYNISFVEVIIRDPLWAFVFWEIKGYEREIHEKANDFKGYCLRVIPLGEEGKTSKVKDESFTITAGVNDSAKYLGFPEHSLQSETRYVVKLNAIRGESERMIAVSLPFTLPALINFEDKVQSPLITLSGVNNFSTIKSTDRKSRAKGQ